VLLPNVFSTFPLRCAETNPFALGKIFLPGGGEMSFWQEKWEEDRGSSTMAGQDVYSITSKWNNFM